MGGASGLRTACQAIERPLGGAFLQRFGAVAQLGERCNGIAEVRGSIPLGSTIHVIIGRFP